MLVIDVINYVCDAQKIKKNKKGDSGNEEWGILKCVHGTLVFLLV